MPDESAPPPLRPLYDVWLKPRRVFRELADTPVGMTDYWLGSLQGIVSWLAFCRAQSAGTHSSVAQILAKGVVIGPIAGVLGIFVMAAVYGRVGRRAGGAATRSQMVHVLAYSGVPLAASLVIWLLAAFLLGRVTFIDKPRADLEPFLALLLQVQFAAHVLLIGWSLLLQVMGFSEVLGLQTRRAFSVWAMGQLLVLLAILALALLLYALGLASLAPADLAVPK